MLRSIFIQNVHHSLFKIINKNQTKQYICEQNKLYRSIQNSNQLNKNITKKIKFKNKQ